MGYKLMQGLGRLVYKEFGVILNEIKSGILLSREVTSYIHYSLPRRGHILTGPGCERIFQVKR